MVRKLFREYQIHLSRHGRLVVANSVSPQLAKGVTLLFGSNWPKRLTAQSSDGDASQSGHPPPAIMWCYLRSDKCFVHISSATDVLLMAR